MKTRGFEICKGYEDNNLQLPKRSTKHAVGYDFCAPEDITIPSIWSTIFKNFKCFLAGTENFLDIKPTKVKTGIKSYFKEDEVFIIANRSSGPSKMGLILANSIGIFECDYYSNPDNDGNIIFQFYNFFPKAVTLKKGDRIGQGYFQNFLTTDSGDTDNIRTGGLGSTGL